MYVATDKLYVGSCYCTFLWKNNLYQFITSNGFLVPITTAQLTTTFDPPTHYDINSKNILINFKLKLDNSFGSSQATLLRMYITVYYTNAKSQHSYIIIP